MNSTIHHYFRFLLATILLLSANYSFSQVSVSATAGTTGPTAYSTVNAALAAITAGTHQGAIIITITGNTTEPTFAAANQLVASGTGLANYQSVLIRPSGNVVVNSAGTPTANRGILEFIGADSITIDGDDPLTPGTRNLTFQVATTTSTYTSALRFSSSAATANTGCRAVTIKNCVIIGGRSSATVTTIGFGITASGQSSATITTLTTQASDNDNWLIENNEFKRVYYAFHAYGHATNVMDSLVIRNNKFGNDTAALNIGNSSIYLGYTALAATSRSAIIEGNEIQGGNTIAGGYGTNICGIWVNIGNAGAHLRNNYIHDIANYSTGLWGVFGIYISSATSNDSLKIYNNIIRDISGYRNGTTISIYRNYGIYIAAAVTNLSILHNTIALNTPNSGGTFSNNFSACIAFNFTSGGSIANFNNNILVNNQGDGPGQVCQGVYLGYAGLFSASPNVNRNNYFTPGVSGYLGRVNTVNHQTLTAWQSATLKDSNSFVSNPPFISTTNLRLQAGVKSILESNGASTSITTDIDGNVRPGPAGSVNGGALAPDIGAHEADMIVDNKQIDSVTVTQITGFVSPGNTNQGILRIAAHVSGSIGVLRLSSLYLNTTGSTAATDISNAKVYFTGSSSTFSIANQYGTVTSTPSGAFVISDTTLINTGINYFWLTYDISGSATNSNVVDARLDSAQYTYNATPSFIYPINGNPVGNVVIAAPMTYISSTATHPTLAKIERGSNNNQILRIRVIMSSVGAPVSVSQLNLDVAGSANPLTNIDSISVWYTGSNANFVSPTLFGAASAQSGPYSVTGAVNLLNDTNYFWVTYRVPITATVGDSVDAEIASITIAGTPQTPSVTAPNGARYIKGAYCTTTYASGCGTDFIARVRLGNLDNSTGCNGQYTFFNNVAVPTLLAGMNYTITLNYGADGSQFARAWIDWNDDGDFDDSGEDLGAQTPANAGSNGQATVSFTVPCNAVSGNLRLRIRGGDDSQPSGTQSCGVSSSGYGEGEDYLVQIINLPATYTASNTIQQTGTTSAGATNLPILRVPLKVIATSCLPGTISELRFNTAGTTSNSDIVAAKLYKTGASSVFNISNLLGTVTSPSGAFSFTISDTTINDSNNYWLAYDVSGTAPNANVLDARFDSAQVFGTWQTPSVSAPAGNVLISTPMTYLGSDAIHPTISRIERGSANNQILRVMVRMSPTGAPIQATQFSLSTNGSANPLTNADSIIVWYTGSNPNFSASTFFGGVGAQSGTFTINGLQNLLNDTNYFWVTYNVPGTATIGDSLDMEINSITINATVQIPTTTAPIGSRQIRAPYCPSGATNSADSDIGRIIMLSGADSIMNVGNGCGTGQTWATGTYTNNTTISGINMSKGSTVNFNICYASSGLAYNSGLAIYIDFNQNGLWDGGEMVYTSPTQLSTSFVGSFNIPCTALNGPTRMRIVSIEFTDLTLANACGTFSYGETEDYTINIINSATSFQATTATQQIGTTSAGSTNIPVLRVPIKVIQNNCSPSQITELRFNTIGTTSVADITAAKLYKTGSSASFSTSNLLGTVTSPSGTFSFIINDTALNDTNNYWLAYDISGTAVNNNVVDARFDSTQVFGGWFTPIISAPAGNVIISTPMTYLASNATHTMLSKIERGTTINQMLRILVRTSSTGAPIQATQFSLSTNGSANPLTNADSIIVWYTGANANFIGATFFGGVGAQSGTFVVNGSRNLLNDTNYFWVTYNVPVSAIIGDSLDAQVNTITIDGTPQTPTTTAPVGARYIKGAYCISTYTSACTSDDLINNVSTTGGITNINNLNSGCNGNANNYVYYPNQTVTVVQGGTFTINYQSGANWDQGFKIYIDYNDDGDFTDAGELVANAPTSTNLNTSFITIPLNAELGNLRMRVRCAYGAEPASPCGAEGFGETEDYNVSVLPAPTPTTYVWNQSGAASFAVAANWTPNRTNTNLNDRLVFSSGGVRIVNNVPQQTVDVVRIENNTTVELNTATVGNLAATDSLSLISGKIVTGTDVRVTSGSRTSYINGEIRTGNISGAGYVNGVIQRWIDTVASVYTFPVRFNDTVRTVIMDYTAGPSAAGTITVQFVPGNPGNAGLPVTDNFVNLNRASENGVWRISQANGLVGGTYNLSLAGNQFRGIINTSSISVIRRLDNVSNWSNNGTYTAATGTTTSPVFNRSGLNVYGEFTAASDTLSNPLPVSLLVFNAKPADNDVVINWTTASEINNKGFNIERSVDGRTFEFVRFVEGAIQSSSVLNYSEIDNEAFSLSNTLYYRLRQIDLDGTETLSKVVKVTRNDIGIANILISPNPFSFNTVVSLSSMEEGNVSIIITDIQGRVIATKNVTIQQGNNSIILNDLEIVSDGVYFIKLSGSATETLKVVKYTN